MRKAAGSTGLEGTCRQKEGQLAGMKAQEEMRDRQEGRQQGAQVQGTCRQKEGQLAGTKAQEEMMEQAGLRVANRLTY